MAELGGGFHRSDEVARVLGKSVRAVAPTRAKLIRKGMVYSPAHGDTAFTVPLFDEYLQRAMPLRQRLTGDRGRSSVRSRLWSRRHGRSDCYDRGVLTRERSAIHG